jgi:Peroxiredoxin
MVKTPSLPIKHGWKAIDFYLPGVDGKTYHLEECKGSHGLLVAFICNHCPYVQAILDKLIRDAKELRGFGINTVAICSNDAEQYPEDSFEKMQKLAEEKQLPFPYLHDKTQEVALAWRAVCTPDFYGFNQRMELEYRGRLDDSGKELKPDARRELFLAMRQISQTGEGPDEQHPSIGCSIKWMDMHAETVDRLIHGME